MNIKQLAKTLNLSTSTVSRALNGYTDVNPDTRLRVQQAAQSLGYRPDASARRLVRGDAEAVGIVYSAAAEVLGNPQFLDMTGGLSDRLEQDQFDLLLALAKDDHELKIYERLFRGGRVDSVIVANTQVHDDRINFLLSKNYPFVAYGRTANCENYSWLDFDNEQSSAIAVEHLLALGHTRIAYVHSPLDLNYAKQRHAGFLEALQKNGLNCPLAYQSSSVNNRRQAIDVLQAWMQLDPAPTAIIADSNIIGMAIFRGLNDLGVKIGQDISLVINGDVSSEYVLLNQPITTVIQPTAHDTGVALAEMTFSLLRNRKLSQTNKQELMPPWQLLKSCQLVVGTSTGPVPVNTPRA